MGEWVLIVAIVSGGYATLAPPTYFADRAACIQAGKDIASSRAPAASFGPACYPTRTGPEKPWKPGEP
jgi:hypothetical protein